MIFFAHTTLNYSRCLEKNSASLVLEGAARDVGVLWMSTVEMKEIVIWNYQRGRSLNTPE